MGLDSAPFFANRCLAAGLTAEHVEKLKQAGWETFGDFAFSTSYMPGMPDDKAFIEEVVEPILGDAKHPLKAKLRRIHAEAYTLAAAEQRRGVERPKDGEVPRVSPSLIVHTDTINRWPS